VAAAAAKIKADEEAAYLAKILSNRQRGDYCDNFYKQLRMTSLDTFYSRCKKELDDLRRFFRISDKTRKYIFR
jgi:hypothetical protein